MATILEPLSRAKPAIFGGHALFDEWLPIVRAELPDEDTRKHLAASWAAIVESGQLTNGAALQRLERLAAEHLGVADCVAVSSCTAGLMLVLRCLELRGEVILPSFTFFATAHAVLWNGLEPVLVDCERGTFNIDPVKVREAITGKTAAIVAVHIFGNPAAIDALESIAAERGIKLIFDAAHGLGARVGGRSVGSSGEAEVFSLSPTKLVVAGEGGLVTTNCPDLAQKLRAARNYGDSGTYDCDVLGLNARLTELQAVLAAAGLAGLEERVARRNRTASIYEHRLSRQPGLSFQRIRESCRSSRKDFALVIDGERFGVSRDFLQAALERDNVQSRRYFDPPLHRQKLYRKARRGELVNTDWISRRVLNLPIYSSLPEQAAQAIAERIIEIRDEVRAGGYPAWWSER